MKWTRISKQIRVNLSRDEVVSAQLFLLELAKIAENIRKKKEPDYCLKNWREQKKNFE